MEKETQSETPKSMPTTGFSFPPHRKSPLRSETYRTLLRFFSLCHELRPQLREIPAVASLELRPDKKNGNGLGQTFEKDMSLRSESLNPRETGCANSRAQRDEVEDGSFEDDGSKDRVVSDAQAAIDEIENVMIREDGDMVKQREPMAVDCDNEKDFQDRRFSLEQELLIDELEHVMKGSSCDVPGVNCITGITAVEENQRGAAVDADVINSQEECSHRQPVAVEASKSVGQQQIHLEHPEQSVCEIFNLSADKSVARCKDISSLQSASELKVLNERSEKETELEKSLTAIGIKSPPSQMIENVTREEGEISDLLESDDRSIGMFSGEGALLEDKEIGARVTDGNVSSLNLKHKCDMSESNSLVSKRVDNATDSRVVEARDKARTEDICKRKILTYEDLVLADEAPLFEKRKVSHEARKQKEGNEDKIQKESKSGKKQKKGSGTRKQKETKKVKEQEKSNGHKKQQKQAKDEIDRLVASPKLMDMDAKKADQSTTVSGEIASEEMQNDGLCNKRKRGPSSKEAKKAKKRRKRAEKNRELGVKRLKLRPILNPKPVSHCRHYLKGRCHEGEKCKFSHDVTPLTKSQPCCHFARHSCMKGENCPFDHQLSKYPCSNYVSKGFCIRGDSCMFSHKVPLMENSASTSNVCTPDLRSPSLPSTSSSKKQVVIGGTCGQTARTLPQFSGQNPCKNTEQNVANRIIDAATVLPRGISFLSCGKSSTVESSDTKRGSSYQKSSEGGKVQSLSDQNVASTGIGFLSSAKSSMLVSGDPKQDSSFQKSNEGVKDQNLIDQSASSRGKSLNENAKVTSGTGRPKGINFLSFGKSPLENFSATNLSINRGGVFPLSSDAAAKQATLPQNVDNSTQGSKLSIQNLAHTSPNYSSVETSADGAGRSKQLSLLSSAGSSVDKSVEASRAALDKHGNSSAIRLSLPASLHGSGQSSDHLKQADMRSTLIAAQKVLSTLAFAANFKSENKLDQSKNGAFGVSSSISKETGASSASGDSRNDSSSNAAKVLAFLSRISSDRK